jgi:hypothetical protein
MISSATGRLVRPGGFVEPFGAVLEHGLDRVLAERAPVRILRLDDPLDRAHPVVEPAGELVQLVEQFLVLRGQGRRVFHLVM